MEGRWKTIISCLMLTMLFAGCDKLKGITTIYGTVTAPGVGPVDSVRITIDAIGGFIPVRSKVLGFVLTDHNGQYQITVDAPRGYDQVGCYVEDFENPKFTGSYRIAKSYQDGNPRKSCCFAAGSKVNLDFEFYP